MSVAASISKQDMDSEFNQDKVEAVEGGRPGWIVFMVGMLISGLIILFVTDRVFNPNKFLIDEIEVYGSFHHVDGEQVKQIVETAIKGNFFSVSLHKLESEIKKIPWVYSVSLRRKWPSTITVDVVEVQPVARWGNDKWLNFTGDLVDRQMEYQMEGNSDLPLLFGQEADLEIIWNAFQQWSGRFASNGLNLNELKLDDTGLWNLKLSLGALALKSEQIRKRDTENWDMSKQVTMVVDRGNAFPRIQRFIAALNQELIVQFPDMNSIDLRYPNGFAIGWLDSKSQKTPDLVLSK
jgi:cell division protein FtsQ